MATSDASLIMHPPFPPPSRDAPYANEAGKYIHSYPPPPAQLSLPPIFPSSHPPSTPYTQPQTIPHPLDVSEREPVGHIVYHPNEPPRIQHLPIHQDPSMQSDFYSPQNSRSLDTQSYLTDGAPRRQAKRITQRRDLPLDHAKYSEPQSPPVCIDPALGPHMVHDMARSYPEQTQAPLAPRSRTASRMQISELISNNADDNQTEQFSPKVPEVTQNLRQSARRTEASRSQRPSIKNTRPHFPPEDYNHVYHLSVRQQPIAARACGFGERDRRVVDPPPILELTVHNKNASAKELAAAIRNPNIVIHCKLLSEDGKHDVTSMPEASDRRPQRRLMGTLVASPFVGRDENDEEGCFFCFPDLSCRTPGAYRLEFSVVVLEPKRMGLGYSSPVRYTIQTNTFHVFSAKEFPGMRASTELTKRLKEQGCLISVKKGSERTAGAGRVHDREESDDDDEYGEEHRSRRQRR